MANIIKKILTGLLLLTVAIFTAGCGSGDSDSNDYTPVDEATAIVYTKEAFTYTFPLVYMYFSGVRFTNTQFATNVSAPVNQISHSDSVGDVNYGQVSNVNRDILCSQAFLDLSRDAVVLIKPDTERFCLFELFDGYTNCVAAMGTGTNNRNTKFIFTGPRYTGHVPSDMTHIKVPTNLARLIGYIRCDGEEEIETVAEIQKQIELKEYSIYRNNGRLPDGNFHLENQLNPLQMLNSLSVKEYFDLANRLMRDNPPANCDDEILNRIRRIRVGPGLSFDPSIYGESNSYRYFESIKQQCMNSDWASNGQIHYFQTSNYNSSIWNFYTSSNLTDFSTNFGTDYNYRAFCAYNYVCTHPNNCCLIMFKHKDDKGTALRGGNRYKLVFQHKRLPPATEFGFWSITAYNAKTGMIQTDDYNTTFSVVNDKSGIGENASGTIEISIEPVSTKKKENRRASRKAEGDGEKPAGEEPIASGSASLPIYDTNDDFFLIMRIYLPKPEALNGFWTAPAVNIVEEEKKKTK